MIICRTDFRLKKSKIELWSLCAIYTCFAIPARRPNLTKSLRSRRHRALLAVLIGSRREIGLTQRALAAKMKRPQSFVAATETGERRLDIVEFFDIAEALAFDPVTLFERVARW